MTTDAMVWLAIGVLVAQSGTFSGLNLALFGVSALRLQTQASLGDQRAAHVLELRRDSNFLLTTILWGNVATNVLLTMVSESILTGAAAFVFSTFVITFGGEILPQAYFSRHALRMASLLAPVFRLYQIVLYPIAKPSALILDAWIGQETVDYLSEVELREALRQHVRSPGSEVGAVEGLGAINFLMLDDLQVTEVGEPVAPASVLKLPHEGDRPVFPAFDASSDDPFLRQVQGSGKRWVLIAPADGVPSLALDASSFLRAAIFGAAPADPLSHCHRPVIVTDESTRLGDVIAHLEAEPGDDVIDQDLILLWGADKRVITGADLLGFLLRGIARRAP